MEIGRPKENEILDEFHDFFAHLLTIERDEDGSVYVVTWYYGVERVLAKIIPGGSVQVRDHDE